MSQPDQYMQMDGTTTINKRRQSVGWPNKIPPVMRGDSVKCQYQEGTSKDEGEIKMKKQKH
jgi:hypothetical protein